MDHCVNIRSGSGGRTDGDGPTVSAAAVPEGRSDVVAVVLPLVLILFPGSGYQVVRVLTQWLIAGVHD
jgi:hypothetical protein